MSNAIQLASQASVAAIQRRAKKDFAFFVECVLTDEATGAPVTLTPRQREWCSLMQNEKRLAIAAHAESGKTSLVVAFILWLLWLDPMERIAVVSNTQAQAAKILALAMRYIESSATLFAITGLQPSQPWTLAALTVVRPKLAKEPSLSAFGKNGAITGARFTRIIVDDFDDFESTRTEAARDQAWQWFKSSVMPRLTLFGRAYCVGMRWAVEDFMSQLEKAGWPLRAYPLLDATGQSMWPERWPVDRIEQVRREVGERTFQRVFQCAPLDEGALIFKREDVVAIVERGKQIPSYQLMGRPPGRFIVAVDPAFTDTKHADETGIVGVLVNDNGTREILSVRGGRWNFDGIIANIVDVAQTFRATNVVCESNGGGTHIAQQVSKRIACKAVPTTATSKIARVEMLASELGPGVNRWALHHSVPKPEAAALVRDLEMASLDAHLGDRLCALLLAVEQIRNIESKPRVRFTSRHLLGLRRPMG
jgi:hypothetical protein